MKPIHLSIAGLQSYRERQDIDFARLCEAGVFGIFGPTGSGKSTVLDAITLALFGEVGRAGKGTQGILNHAEQTLNVSFTFALSGADGTHTYRVERQYKRKADLSCENTVSRLLLLRTDGADVIADKSREVIAKVQDILGLNMSDFTRAVVLPQGKFAEFLSLTGAERRQMLQRLFHLHPYGDGLAANLQKRRAEAESALNATLAEQQGLGDASREAVEAAAARLREAREAERRERAALAETEAAYQEAKRRWELQRTADELRRERAQLEAMEPEMREREERIDRSERAARLIPFWRERQEAERACAETRADREKAERELAEAREAMENAQELYEAARKNLSDEEPCLRVRLSELEQVAELQGTIEQFRFELERLEARCRDLAAAKTDAERQRAEAVGRRDKALRLQAELKEELRRCEVTADVRERAIRALRMLEALEHLDGQLDAADRECRLREAAQASLLRKSEELDGQAERLERDMAAFAAETAGRRNELLQWQSDLERLLRDLEVAAEANRRERSRLETARLASRLAAELRSGEPCPVCGSTDHPRPAAETRAESAGEGAGDAVPPHPPEGAGNAVPPHLREEADPETMIPTAREALLQAGQLRYRLEQTLRALDAGAGSRDSSVEREAAVGVADPEDMGGFHGGHPRVDGFLDEYAGVPHGDAENRLAENCHEENRHEENRLVENRDDAGGRTLLQPFGSRAGTAGFGDASEAHGVSSIGAKFRQLVNRLPVWSDTLARLELAADERRKRLGSLQRQRDEVQAQLAAAASVLDEAKVKRDEMRSRRNALVLEWRSALPDLEPERARGEVERLRERDRQAEALRVRLANSEPYLAEQAVVLENLQRRLADLERDFVQAQTLLESRREQLAERTALLRRMIGDEDAAVLQAQTMRRLQKLTEAEATLRDALEQARSRCQTAAQRLAAAEQAHRSAVERAARAAERWVAALAESPFESGEEVQSALLDPAQARAWLAEVRQYREQQRDIGIRLRQIESQLDGDPVPPDEWERLQRELAERKQACEDALRLVAKCERDMEELEIRHKQWSELEIRRREQEVLLGRLQKLQQVLRGNAFVEFVAEEQLHQVSRAASERLGFLTRRRYALELDSAGGFVIRDDANGGVRRPVSTLSGGETFLTSLSLALALSAQIQLRGRYPLQFFFLDEGFGTLDPELLDTVISALEKLHSDRLAVGVISHVPELRARLPRRLIVHPAEPSGRGSRVELELM